MIQILILRLDATARVVLALLVRLVSEKSRENEAPAGRFPRDLWRIAARARWLWWRADCCPRTLPETGAVAKAVRYGERRRTRQGLWVARGGLGARGGKNGRTVRLPGHRGG